MRRRIAAGAALVMLLGMASPAAGADRENYAFLSENSEFGWAVVVTGAEGAQEVQVASDAVGRPAISPNGS